MQKSSAYKMVGGGGVREVKDDVDGTVRSGINIPLTGYMWETPVL